jgi:hypothetical protein
VAKVLGALFATLLLVSPTLAGEKVSYRDFLARNRTNSSSLALGMTKDEVKSAMGDFEASTRDGPLYNPWLAEAFSRGGDSFEVLYYLVRQHPPFTPILRGQAIAVVLKNGELVAWGPDADARFR